MTKLKVIQKPLDLPMVAQSLDYTCGAACFDSMFNYFTGISLGEMHFANELETIALGYTPPIHVVNLARKYGFSCEMTENAQIINFVEPLYKGEVIFVTWWDEDAGHYSLVKHLGRHHIILMDPWLARLGLDNRLATKDFVLNWNARGSRMIRVFLA
jgi:predicted double-glycine peptidase